MRLCGAQMYRDNYGNYKQFTELRQRCAELARENAEAKKTLDKVLFDLEQHKTLLVCLRHLIECNKIEDCTSCHTCIVTHDMYMEFMS